MRTGKFDSYKGNTTRTDSAVRLIFRGLWKHIDNKHGADRSTSDDTGCTCTGSANSHGAAKKVHRDDRLPPHYLHSKDLLGHYQWDSGKANIETDNGSFGGDETSD